MLPRLTNSIPPAPVHPHHWHHLDNLELADPTFATPGPVDILLGADVYGHLLQDEVRKGRNDAPVAQRTSLGWIISGPTSAKTSKLVPPLIGLCAADEQLQDAVHAFWSQETVPPPVSGHLSEADQLCESLFRSSHSRDSTGRYTVRLPFKSTPVELGASRPGAARMLETLQRKFRKDPAFYRLYSDFITEYESLGHMKEVKSSSGCAFFLPHHGVLRESSTTTKLRVVFNGSHKTSSGTSLNDNLLPGPKLQQDLVDVLLRWRLPTFVFCSDIEKMYRQIAVHPDDRKYQCILWQKDFCAPVSTYQLTTVTYGLSCAPYLAIRVLHQLAHDEGEKFPLAAKVTKFNMYVDDVLAGADSVEEARDMVKQVDGMLMAGGFHLQKWVSNEDSILNDIEAPRQLNHPKTFDGDLVHRALGLKWSHQSDALIFTFNEDVIAKGPATKRSVLSLIARLFDPLGLLAPVIVKAKIFLQSLWTAPIQWDDPLPDSLAAQWTEFLQEMRSSPGFSIPRWLGTTRTSIIELHGFSDASRSALSAAVYVRVLKDDLTARVTLLTAKTKVAPLKPVTIPRLELSAATLLAQLISQVCRNSEFLDAPVYSWVDSSVALTWIRGHPSQWKEFVSNRVALIQELLPRCYWNHVAGAENPADIASRGALPSNY